jgi:hypothetical protein
MPLHTSNDSKTEIQPFRETEQGKQFMTSSLTIIRLHCHNHYHRSRHHHHLCHRRVNSTVIFVQQKQKHGNDETNQETGTGRQISRYTPLAILPVPTLLSVFHPWCSCFVLVFLCLPYHKNYKFLSSLSLSLPCPTPVFSLSIPFFLCSIPGVASSCPCFSLCLPFFVMFLRLFKLRHVYA